MNQLTPTQALENLAVIAADYPLTVKNRNVINDSIAILDALVKASQPQPEAPEAKP